MKHPASALGAASANARPQRLREDIARPEGRAESTSREIFLSHVAWPEEAQLLHDDYWGPRLRAHRARALLRRLAIGGALLAGIALIAAAATLIPAPTPSLFEEQPVNP